MSEKFFTILGAWCVLSAIRSLHQDMIGMERYIELIRAGWISPWFTVPLALFGLLVGFSLLRNGEKHREGR